MESGIEQFRGEVKDQEKAIRMCLLMLTVVQIEYYGLSQLNYEFFALPSSFHAELTFAITNTRKSQTNIP